MLSHDAVKLLKWLQEHDHWMTPKKIKKDCKVFNDRTFKALITGKMVKIRLAEDGDNWTEYRISDSGKAYLEDLRAQRLPELREWINTLIPIITFLAGLSLSDPIKAFLRWLMNLLD